MNEPNQLLSRLNGELGDEAQEQAMRHMLSVYIQSSLSLFMVLGAGGIEPQMTLLGIEGRPHG